MALLTLLILLFSTHGVALGAEQSGHPACDKTDNKLFSLERAQAKRGEKARFTDHQPDVLIAKLKQAAKSSDPFAYFKPGENLRKFIGHKFHPTKIYGFLGANVSASGTKFAIWAPNAQKVSVVSEYGGWDKHFELEKDHNTGVWFGEVVGIKHGTQYKYHLTDVRGRIQWRADPVSRFLYRDPLSFDELHPPPPSLVKKLLTFWNSVVWDPKQFKWEDDGYRPVPQGGPAMEVHLGSLIPGNPWASYEELADYLIPILERNNFTSINLMPETAHAVPASWGYQIIGLFSTNYRHGNPDGFKGFINRLHKAGIAITLDVAHGHGSKDAEGLGYLDGTQLYFHDGDRGNSLWGTFRYDFGREVVRDYLLSNIRHMIEEFHIDGFRFDGIAESVYHRWMLRVEDTNIDYEAVEYYRMANVLAQHYDKWTEAEDTSGIPEVMMPIEQGGMGFLAKWGLDMKYHIRRQVRLPLAEKNLFLVFRPEWESGYRKNYVDSHDETSHGARRFIDHIRGVQGENERFAFARLVDFHLAFALEGSPFVFMGSQFAQRGWWDERTPMNEELFLCSGEKDARERHRTFERFSGEKNKFWLENKHFHSGALHPEGKLIDNNAQVTVVFRTAEEGKTLVVVENWSGQEQTSFKISVPTKENHKVVFSTDADRFGGDDIPIKMSRARESLVCEWGTQNGGFYVEMNLPPFSGLVIAPGIL